MGTRCQSGVIYILLVCVGGYIRIAAFSMLGSQPRYSLVRLSGEVYKEKDSHYTRSLVHPAVNGHRLSDESYSPFF